MTYKLVAERLHIPPAPQFVCVVRVSDGAFIPLTLQNVDCAKFLEDWIAGVAVQRPNGNAYAYTAAHRTALGL